MYYEYSKAVFFTSTGDNLCDVVVGFDRVGMDDADYVHDEIPVKIRG